MTDTIICKKYAGNRRLYNETKGAYSTLAELDVQLQMGKKLLVYLDPGKLKKKEGQEPTDITNQILLRVLLAREIAKPSQYRTALLDLINGP